MSMEMESLWDAMKDVHYKRTIERLEEGIRNANDLKGALTAALDQVVEAAHAEAGTFWFYDKYGDGRIRPKAVYGGGDLGNFSLAPGEGVAGQVVESGKGTIIADCQKDPRWAGKADKKTGFTTKSMVCVPLRVEEDVFGCIQIINKTDGTLFDEKELTFAVSLAEASAGMFRKQGLLKGYLNPEAEDTGKLGFGDIFTVQDPEEMEELLRSVEEFVALGVKDQEAVLKSAREIHGIFRKQRNRRGSGRGLFRW